MLKKVNILIKSAVTTDADPTPERTEERRGGYVKYTDGSGVSLLSYKSESEGGIITTELFFEDGAVRIVRRGAIESEMLIEVGKRHSSLYKIPPYAFDMSVTGESVRGGITPDGGELELAYSMSIGGVEKRCLMHITVK